MTVTKKEMNKVAAGYGLVGRSWMNKAQLTACNNAHAAGEPLPVFEKPAKKVKEKTPADEPAPVAAEEVDDVPKKKRNNGFHMWCLKHATDEGISYSAAKKLGALYKTEMENKNKNNPEVLAAIEEDIAE